MHVRQQIREAAKAILIGIPGIGTNVFANRTMPIQGGVLPALRIQTLEEQVEFLTGDQLDRQLTLSVEIVGREDYSDAVLDDFAEVVEQRLAVDPTLGGLAHDSVITGTSLDAESDSNLRQLTLTYLIQYITTPGAPQTAR